MQFNARMIGTVLIGAAAILGIFFLNRGEGPQVIQARAEGPSDLDLEAAAGRAAEAQTGEIVEEIGGQLRSARSLLSEARSLTAEPESENRSGGDRDRGRESRGGFADNDGGVDV